MVGARLITRVFDLVTMLVLARILQPTDFGLVAIAMTLVSIVEAALELPLNQALLRLPVITAAQYDTAFTLSALRGLLLTLIVVLASWPFAGFYADDRLVPLVCMLSIAPTARGLTSPRLAKYHKEMNFWRDFAIELAGKLIGFTVGLGIAILTRSYWSIAAGVVAYPLAMAIGSYVLAPYRPRLSLAESHLFSGFIGWTTAAQIVSALNWQFERLLLGKLQATSQLGLFATASDLANIPVLALFSPIMRPILAAFSQLRNEDGRLARSYQTASSAIVMVGVPLLVGESLLAEPIVLLILGEKWRGAIPLLRWLSVSLIPGLFALPAVPLVMFFGKTEIILKRNLVEFCIKTPILIIGVLNFGFAGVIFSRFLSEAISVVFWMNVVRRLVGLSIADQLLASWRAVLSTVIMIAPVLLCLRQIPVGGGTSEIALGLIITASIGATVYGAALYTLWVFSGYPSGIESLLVNKLGSSINKRQKPT